VPHFPTPHARYRHIFVVVRLPRPDTRGGDGHIHEDHITLTKAFLKERAAQEEVDRLNELNREYWSYSINVARLVEDPRDDGGS
jgi:hypothetical protein